MPRQPALKPLPGAPRPVSPLRRWLLRGLVLCLIAGAALGIGGSVALLTLYNRLPDVRQLEQYTPPQATEIYDGERTLLTRISSGEGRYEPISLAQIPKHVQAAVISAEDRRFWEHRGVDPLGIARAIVVNLRSRTTVGGASTLTQQLIKNLLLTPERSAKRKIAEALLAVKLERQYSKQQILELYLNHVFLGHNVYGIRAAAQIYFGKEPAQLSLAEGALLAGIIRSPEYLSPYHNREGARKVQEIVLRQMRKDTLISEMQHQEALATPLRLVGLRQSYPYPYFLDYVLYSARAKVGEGLFRQGGLKIYTTLRRQAQAQAELALQNHRARLGRLGAQQAALVSLDPHTGLIQAMVGGMDYSQSQFNRAFQAQRQVGSTFKPFVYLTAFEQGQNTQTTIEDTPTRFGNWRPQNWDRRFHGQVTLAQALAQSMNVATVKLAEKVSMDRVLETVQKAGVRSAPPANDLSVALGSAEMNLLELTAAYGSFANGGIRLEPTAITRITIGDQLYYEYVPPQERIFSREAVSELNRALQQVITGGTGKAAAIGRPAAGKTGTTDRAYDTWFVGYVPQLVTGVWAGNDTPSATRGGGGSVCAPIWRQYMLAVTRRLPVENFEQIAPSASPSESASPSGASPSPSGEAYPSPTSELTPETPPPVESSATPESESTEPPIFPEEQPASEVPPAEEEALPSKEPPPL
jgi:penicillin-binding protein 1A